MLYVEESEVDVTDAIHIAVPDERTFIVRSLLNYEAPHYFARFQIPGCPPGLEILDKYEHLLITRRLQNSIDLQAKHRLQAFTQFDIKNSRGMQLYLALEEIVSKKQIRWTRDARLFEVTFFDFHCRQVFKIKRTWSCSYCFAQYLCLFCTYGYQGCGNAVDVFLADGSFLGSVKQKISFSSSAVFHVCNKQGKCIMVIEGIFSDGILDVCFFDDDEPIAMIETLMGEQEVLDYYKVVVPSLSSSGGITFFKNFITPDQKALLLSAAILLDYMALEPTSDYPHVVQVIPEDFQSLPRPHSTLHTDGSKELLILRERKKKSNKYDNRKRIKGKWGCCIWCCKLSCVCCFLGVKRNAVRCILLIIGIIFVIVSTFLFFAFAWDDIYSSLEHETRQ